MKHWLAQLFGALFPSREPRNIPLLSPEQFTDHYVAAAKLALPNATISIEEPLLVVLKCDGSSDTRSFLHNAYEVYQQKPADLKEVVERYVSSSAETLRIQNAPFNPNRIVPLVKDSRWLEETQRNARSATSGKALDNVFDYLNEELVVLYAEDTEKCIRYFNVSDLPKIGIARDTLRSRAIDNLRQLLPEIRVEGKNGLYMVAAGGDYEASLLLVDSIWDPERIKVKGDFVAAIPARDLLFVTGSEDPAGLELLRKVVDKASQQATYRLTSALFIRRNGQFEVFNAD